MRLLIIISVLFAFSANIFAQKKGRLPKSELLIHQSDYIKTKKFGEYVGFDSDGIYFWDLKKRKLTIRTYSINAKLINTNSIELPDRYTKLDIRSIRKINETIIVKSVFNNKKLLKSFKFTETFDFLSGKIISEFKKYQIIPYRSKKALNSIFDWYTNEKYNFEIELVGEDIIGKWSINLLCDNKDDNLQSEYQKINIARDLGQLHRFMTFIPYNNGNNIAFLTKYYKSEKESKMFLKSRYRLEKDVVKAKVSINNYHYAITLVDISDTRKLKVLKQITVGATGDDFIKSVTISDIGHDSLLITGAYAVGVNINTKGVYSHIINTAIDNAVNIANKYKFTDEFIKKYRTEHELKEMDKAEKKGQPYDFFKYNTIRLIINTDGSYIAAIEKTDFYETIVQQRMGNMISYTTIYNKFSADVFLTYISNSGEIEDVIKIPKRQVQAKTYPVFDTNIVIKKYNDKVLIVCADQKKKYGGTARRVITYVIDDKDKKLKSDIVNTYKNIEKASLTFKDIWIGDYKLISIGNRLDYKKKLIILDLEKFINSN